MKKLSFVIVIAILALCASCTLDPTEVLTISSMGGTVDNDTQVSITTSVSDAQIRYTLDGTDPKYGSALYVSPINITKNTVLKVSVFREKRRLSKVATLEFFVKAATPTSSVVSGTYGTSQTLTLSSTTQNATIYYTLDGTTPTTSSDVYSDTITLGLTPKFVQLVN